MNLNEVTVDAAVAAEMVVVTMGLNMRVRSVRIDPLLLREADPEVIEFLLAHAVNRAVDAAVKRYQELRNVPKPSLLWNPGVSHVLREFRP